MIDRARTWWAVIERRLLSPMGLLRPAGAGVVLHCPLDDWDYAPYFTDGRCPLCGYEAPGTAALVGPIGESVDWFWPLAGTLMAVSVLMAVLVVIAYNKG